MRRLCLVLLTLCTLCDAVSLYGYEVFVSPQGNDKWTGKLAEPNAEKSDGPVATLPRARDLLRAFLRKSKDGQEAAIVTLRQGVHRLSEPLQLGQGDSGTEKSPVVYRSYQGEEAIISGGIEVKDFQTSSQNIYRAKLPESVGDLAAIRVVLHKGQRMPMARWPNRDPKAPIAGGWAYVDGQRPKKQSEKIQGETEANRSQFKMTKADQRRWQNPAEGELFIFTRYNYWNDIVAIQSVDNGTGLVELKDPCTYAIRPGDRYFIQGHREELDAPGEWYIDRDKRELLIYSSAANPKIALDVAITPTLIGFRQGASDIRFEKLKFECCTGTAVNVVESKRCQIVNCTIQHVGDVSGHGVAFHDGENNRVEGGEIYDVGASAVYMTGGETKTLTPSSHVVQNCHIHHVGLATKQTGAIMLGGVGNSALNNEIHDCPRMAVKLTFGPANQQNVVEYNRIARTNLETQDSGAIYASGRDWVSGRGHKIRFNVILDSVGFGWNETQWSSNYYAWGIYLDDACSSTEVYGNVVARCSRGCIMVHSGQNNRIANNIFVDGGKQQIELRGWESDYSYWQSLLATMDKRYEEVKTQPAWKAIPGFGPPRESASQDGKVMVDNIFEKNIIAYKGRDIFYMDVVDLPIERFECDNNLIFARGQAPAVRRDEKNTIVWKQWQAAKLDVHSKQGDPKFKDAAKDDYHLAEDSPALRLGFDPIPFEKIGIQAP